MLVLFAECWDSKSLIQVRVEKVNKDLHQPSRIRYESRYFSVRCLVSLAYREGLISRGNLSIMVPQAIGISLRNRIGNSAGEFLVIFPLGVFIGIQCSWIALISLFLSQVWGHVFLVVSDRSKFCLSLFVYLIFNLFFFLYTSFVFTVPCTCGFPRIAAYIRGFFAHSRVCPKFFLLGED